MAPTVAIAVGRFGSAGEVEKNPVTVGMVAAAAVAVKTVLRPKAMAVPGAVSTVLVTALPSSAFAAWAASAAFSVKLYFCCAVG